jgi:hypothetical protein
MRWRTSVCQKVAQQGPKSKHPFDKWLDTEQTFVIRWPDDEQMFDTGAPGPAAGNGGGPVVAALSFPASLTRVDGRRSRNGVVLQLVDGGYGRRHSPSIDPDARPTAGGSPVLARVPDPARLRTRRRPSAAVRLRRTLLAASGLLVIGLALPLGGAGGHSHASGPALAETTHPIEYTVQPGDTLWSIAVAVDPSADPRPLVATFASQTGSYTVEPGERIAVP